MVSVTKLAPGSAVERPALARGPVLVVDDSKAMRGIVVRRLKEAGVSAATVEEASNGEEALRVAESSRPSLIVADWNMPGMDGVELIRRAKARNPATVCVLISSEAAKVRDSAVKAGATFVLSKPITTDALREALGPLLGGKVSTVPSADAVSRLLSNLLGRSVKAQPCYRAVLAGTKPVLVGLYGSDPSTPAALVACDMELAAHIGAAMVMAPPAQAAECIQAGKFPESTLECLREFMSVAAGFLGGGGGPAPSLRSVHVQLRELPPKAVALAVSPKDQAVFSVEIAGYGGGGMVVCAS